MSIKFLKYQTDLYNNKSRFKIILKGRQLGVSTVLAYQAAINCIFNNRSQIIVSASQRQSNHINQMISRYLPTMIKYANSKGLNITLTSDTKTEKQFSNGKSIHTMPCSPNTIRGFSGDVFVDEFALHRYDKEILTAITPIITRGYNITIASTPLGQNNAFYEVWNNTRKYDSYDRIQISIYDAIKDGLDIDIEQIRAGLDEDSFEQEYNCQFIDESSSYFPFSLIKSCITDISTEFMEGETFMGIDVGRINDRTEIITVVKVNDQLFIKNRISLQNTPFDEQYQIIKNEIDRQKPISIYGDSTGLGRQLMEQLSSTDSRVVGMSITNANKNDMFTNMKMLMEKGMLRFEADETLIRQLHSIRRSLTASNNVKFEGSRDTSGHYDAVVALGMSLLAHKAGDIVPSLYIF